MRTAIKYMYLLRYARFHPLPPARARGSWKQNMCARHRRRLLATELLRKFFLDARYLETDRQASSRTPTKRIFIVVAPSPLTGSLSLFRSRGPASTLWSAVDADWLTIAPCIKLRLRPRIYPCTFSPAQFHERVLPGAPFSWRIVLLP